MNRVLFLVVGALAFTGCDELDADDCRDDCLYQPGFQNCQWCKCQDHQRSQRDHVCCQGADCASGQGDMSPQCAYPDNGQLYMVVEGLQSSPVQPKACTPFSIIWNYVNLSSGDMTPPASYGLPPTQLQVHEVNGSSPDILREVSWKTVPACGREGHEEKFPEGLVPTTSSVGTYSVSFINIPASVPGAATSLRVDSTNSPCP